MLFQVPTPWLQIFLSPPVWAITVANFCSNFGFYILLTTMPTYFSQALGFDLGKVISKCVCIIHVCIHVCMYVCMYVCTCTYVHVRMYMNVCM